MDYSRGTSMKYLKNIAEVVKVAPIGRVEEKRGFPFRSEVLTSISQFHLVSFFHKKTNNFIFDWRGISSSMSHCG